MWIALAAQALAGTPPAAVAPQPVGARVTALATVEILPAATTRDQPADRPLHRHHRAGEGREISLEFE